MQCVILAGGLGTRLKSLTIDQPKAMVDVNGRPFLEYEVALLRSHGIQNFVLCVGHLAEKIEAYFGDGSAHGVSIRYSREPDSLLGTAGAVKLAERLLEGQFLLTYADAYLPMDYASAWEAFARIGLPAMMVVYRNRNRFDRSNLVVSGGKVRIYDKARLHPGMEYINFGVSLLRKQTLELVPSGKTFSQEEWYERLIGEGQLAAFETANRFYEIGSPEGLAEFRRLVSDGLPT
jgi:NDP-sugar pyrophosphorylase family protein